MPYQKMPDPVQKRGEQMFLWISYILSSILFLFLAVLLLTAFDLYVYSDFTSRILLLTIPWIPPFVFLLINEVCVKSLFALPPRVPKWVSMCVHVLLIVFGGISVFCVVPAWKRGWAARILSVFVFLLFLVLLFMIPITRQSFLSMNELAEYGYESGSVALPGMKNFVPYGVVFLWGAVMAGLSIPLFGIHFSLAMRISTAVLLFLLVLWFALPYPLMSMVDAKFNRRVEELRRVGGVIDRSELEERYFQGAAPNPEWCAVVDAYTAIRHVGCKGVWDKQREQIIENLWDSEKTQLSKIPEQYRNSAIDTAILMISVDPDSEYPKPDFAALSSHFEKRYPPDAPEIQMLDRLFAPDSPRLLYARDYSGSVFEGWMDWDCLRHAGNGFEMRGFFAALRGDTDEVLRCFRLCLRAADQLFYGGENLGWGTTRGFVIELHSQRIIQCALSNRCLSLKDLDAVEQTLAAREKTYREIKKSGCFNEAIYPVEIVGYFKNGRIWNNPEQYAVSPMRNPVQAIQYCYLQNDGVHWLNVLTRGLESIKKPDFDPERLDLYPEYFGIRESKRSLSETYGPYFDYFWEFLLRWESYNRMAQIACRIERFRQTHDRLPKTLAELGPDLPHDPFSQKTFGYQPGENDDGFRLWGISRDRKDDGGKSPKDDVFNVPPRGSNPMTSLDK